MMITARFSQKGSSLLDVLIGSALLLVVFLGLFGAFKLSLELVQSTKSKTGALALANERLEFIRSLPYDDIGTVGGIPSGEIVAEETETLNNVDYTRRTFVQYTDAPEDGSGGADENGITTDYKTAKVTMEWQFRGDARSLSLVTAIAPQGIESVSSGGTLNISVLDAVGSAVPSAQVSVVNAGVSPSVSLSTFTNTDGKVSFPGTPAAGGYEITVSKSGHNSDQTYSVTGSNPNPNPGHLTVVESETTSATFFVDVLSSLQVRTFEVGTTTPLENIALTLTGEKTIGTDSGDDPVYKYESSINTGSSGSVLVSNLEWDNYTISIDDVAVGYDLAEVCMPQPIALAPGENESVDLYLADNTAHSLLVDVKDTEGNILPNADVRLYRSGYDEVQSTGSCGQTFFSGLGEGTVSGGDAYALDVSLSGYTSETDDVLEISGATRASVVLNDAI